MSYQYSNESIDDDYDEDEEEVIKTDIVVGENFRTLEKIGSGSFGQIYLGEKLDTQEKVAIKFELAKNSSAQLYNENKVYQILGRKEGLPEIYWFGQTGRHNVMVMEILGKNLEEAFQSCEHKFSIRTICYIALQLLTRFEYIHSRRIAYRDVKPENFLLGAKDGPAANVIHVVDFGLSKEYIDSATGMHIPYREGKNLTGTARYMSINSHLGVEQSRRDDLEALGHLFIYFLREGKLPWSGLKAPTLKERYRKIGELKQTIPLDKLCEGFPSVFPDFLAYTRQLGFAQDPEYQEWKTKFEGVFESNNQHDKDNDKYEWEGKLK